MSFKKFSKSLFLINLTIYLKNFFSHFFLVINDRSMKLGLEQYKMYLEELAKGKKVELAEIKKKMANCGPPGFTGAVGAVCMPIYDQILSIQYKVNHKSCP
jgi:hypothetical protein